MPQRWPSRAGVSRMRSSTPAAGSPAARRRVLGVRAAVRATLAGQLGPLRARRPSSDAPPTLRSERGAIELRRSPPSSAPPSSCERPRVVPEPGDPSTVERTAGALGQLAVALGQLGPVRPDACRRIARLGCEAGSIGDARPDSYSSPALSRSALLCLWGSRGTEGEEEKRKPYALSLEDEYRDRLDAIGAAMLELYPWMTGLRTAAGRAAMISGIQSARAQEYGIEVKEKGGGADGGGPKNE